jgi:hypothetical protein
MEGTTAGALIPEIVRRGFQDLLESEVSAAIGAQLHERRPDERSTHRNGYRERLLTTQVGDLSLAIPKLRQGSFFPSWLEPRRRVDKALYAVVMEAYTGGISTRKVDALVEALGSTNHAALSGAAQHLRRGCRHLRHVGRGGWRQPGAAEIGGLVCGSLRRQSSSGQLGQGGETPIESQR